MTVECTIRRFDQVSSWNNNAESINCNILVQNLDVHTHFPNSSGACESRKRFTTMLKSRKSNLKHFLTNDCPSIANLGSLKTNETILVILKQ